VPSWLAHPSQSSAVTSSAPFRSSVMPLKKPNATSMDVTTRFPQLDASISTIEYGVLT
jgi:hypothetical protein